MGQRDAKDGLDPEVIKIQMRAFCKRFHIDKTDFSFVDEGYRRNDGKEVTKVRLKIPTIGLSEKSKTLLTNQLGGLQKTISDIKALSEKSPLEISIDSESVELVSAEKNGIVFLSMLNIAFKEVKVERKAKTYVVGATEGMFISKGVPREIGRLIGSFLSPKDTAVGHVNKSAYAKGKMDLKNLEKKETSTSKKVPGYLGNVPKVFLQSS